VLDHPDRPPSWQSHPPTGTASVFESIEDYSWTPVVSEDLKDLPPPPAWLLDVPAATPAAAARPAPNIKLPSFRSGRPAAWLDIPHPWRVRPEGHVHVLLCGMEEEQMQQVDDLIKMDPLLPDTFYHLRDQLVATHSLDAYQRLEQLLTLPPLGGKKPSTLLANMKQLCPPGEGATMMFRGMFLLRLPPLIRLQLAEGCVSPVHALVARADALIAHNNSSSVAAPLLEDLARRGSTPLLPGSCCTFSISSWAGVFW